MDSIFLVADRLRVEAVLREVKAARCQLRAAELRDRRRWPRLQAALDQLSDLHDDDARRFRSLAESARTAAAAAANLYSQCGIVCEGGQ